MTTSRAKPKPPRHQSTINTPNNFQNPQTNSPRILLTTTCTSFTTTTLKNQPIPSKLNCSKSYNISITLSTSPSSLPIANNSTYSKPTKTSMSSTFSKSSSRIKITAMLSSMKPLPKWSNNCSFWFIRIKP